MSFQTGVIAAIILSTAGAASAQSFSFTLPKLTFPAPPPTDAATGCDSATPAESCGTKAN